MAFVSSTAILRIDWYAESETLVINMRDEGVNRDIVLESLSDIQIFIHYTDFTVF